MNRKRGEGKDEVPVFFSMDDPYWAELMNKNQKRQHIWRTPSYLAWNHKPHGIIDEIIDMKKVMANMKIAAKYT